jgi:uncharacterized protein YjbI with pentapeptide repeats
MFQQQEYENETFRNVVVKDEVLENLQFYDCTFIKCDFSSTVFKNTVFRSCLFEECDLGLVRVDGSVFKGVAFVNSKVIGVNWANASWGRKSLSQLLKSIDFRGCVLNYSSFFGLVLEKIEIVNCIAHEVDFSGTNLKEANLRGTDFEKSIFRQTNLEKADLVKAKNYMIPPDVNTLKKTKFSLPEAMALLYSMDIVLEEDPAEG